MIISYEMLRQSIDMVKQVPLDICICDEGHRLKNDAAKISRVRDPARWIACSPMALH